MQRLLERDEIPTALYVTNDVVALGVMESLRKEGLQVPRDVSLIGCDDIDIYAQAEPPLTTVCTDLEEFGATGVQKLFTLMEDPRQEARSIKVPLQLVIRGSAGPRSKMPERRPSKDRAVTRSR
jgi:LacI family transcriptional regulator